MTFQSDEDLIGQVLIGKYRIERELGVGGMGAVYQARQVGLERPVAVKVLRRELASDKTHLARFQREATAAASMGHPNIAQVSDLVIEPDEDLALLVMELVEGRSLHEIIEAEGPLSPERAIPIATQVLSALGTAHANGIVHRDVKPTNIMISEVAGLGEVAKLVDFGIAKLLDSEAATKLTATGISLGTPAFMSPEQAMNSPVDERTDLYALGVVLFKCLSNELPFSSGGIGAQLVNLLVDEARSLGEVAPDLDSGLIEVVDRSIRRNADDRFQTAADMADALALWSAPEHSDERATQVDSELIDIDGDEEATPLEKPARRTESEVTKQEGQASSARVTPTASFDESESKGSRLTPETQSLPALPEIPLAETALATTDERPLFDHTGAHEGSPYEASRSQPSAAAPPSMPRPDQPPSRFGVGRIMAVVVVVLLLIGACVGAGMLIASAVNGSSSQGERRRSNLSTPPAVAVPQSSNVAGNNQPSVTDGARLAKTLQCPGEQNLPQQLKGITIDAGQAYGIMAQEGCDLVISNCHLKGHIGIASVGGRVRLVNCTVEASMGINAAGGSVIELNGVTIRSKSGQGLVASGQARVSVRHTTIKSMSYGLIAMGNARIDMDGGRLECQYGSAYAEGSGIISITGAVRRSPIYSREQGQVLENGILVNNSAP